LKENRSGELFPGAFANVHLILARQPAPIIIPINSLIFRSEGSEVATVTDQSTVHLKKVSIGHDYGTT
jgi:multidrug efflux pump subunit AcrA (membrane-fusion protein)